MLTILIHGEVLSKPDYKSIMTIFVEAMYRHHGAHASHDGRVGVLSLRTSEQTPLQAGMPEFEVWLRDTRGKTPLELIL